MESTKVFCVIVGSLLTAQTWVQCARCPDGEQLAWLPEKDSPFEIALDPPVDRVKAKHVLSGRGVSVPTGSTFVIARTDGGIFRAIKLCMKTQLVKFVEGVFSYVLPVDSHPLPTVILNYTISNTNKFRRRCFDLSPQGGNTSPGIPWVKNIAITVNSNGKKRVKAKNLRMKGCLQFPRKG